MKSCFIDIPFLSFRHTLIVQHYLRRFPVLISALNSFCIPFVLFIPVADIPVPGDEMTVRVSSKNRPGYHWAIDEGIEGYLMNQPELFKELCQINIIIN